ncbi:MAG: chemotaxis protein CheA [Cyclobacteriaceae bacterium]|nr:chemotaxis protein CheA [Cyclobacteriaceae bacterium]
MKSKEEEYKEIFLAEALENHEEVNRLLTDLEKNTGNREVIDAIFRITHTLKGNALGMGFADIGEFAHVLEDLFGEVREGKLVITGDIITMLFRAVDVLGALIDALTSGKSVRRKGIQTKMEVLLKRARGEEKPDGSHLKEKQATTPEQDSEEDLKTEDDGEVKKEEKKKAENSAGKDKEKKLNEVKKAENSNEETIQEPVQPSEVVREQAKEEDQEQGEKVQVQDSKITFSDLVQVPVRKLDNLLNLVGELIIERDRIIAANSQAASEYSRLNRISSDLQYSVMDVRLVQVGFLFNKFHRVARDAAAVEKKKVNLKLTGTETEIDRNILQIISDSMIHIVRNSIGHGIELPEKRKSAGKDEVGLLELSAKSESDAVIIDIIDDGQGIDVEKVRQKIIEKGMYSKEVANQLSEDDIVMSIFEPGFSTADSVTAISGRGVGMDVVKKALDSIGGSISVYTKKGKGTTISLRLPSSMAVKGTLLFELNEETFAIPLTYTEAVVSLKKKDIHKVGKGLMSTHLGKTISVVFLRDVFSLDEELDPDEWFLHKSFDELEQEKDLHIAICAYNNRVIGFVVDKLLQRKEIVEKPLMKPVDNVKFVSGVTIMGNGNVCLVINVGGITNFVFSNSMRN